MTYAAEFAESRAHTYHWLYALAALGPRDPSITADTPLYGVFDDGGTTTYAAYNPADEPLTVTFSDGTELAVEAHELATTSVP